MNLHAELRSTWMCIFTDKKQSWFSQREVLSRLWSQSRVGERTGTLAPRLPDTQKKPQVHMTSSFYSGEEYWVSCLLCCFLLFKSQTKVRSADIWSAKRLQENENRFVHVLVCYKNRVVRCQVFIDPTFFGIFICGPLQSFVVNVCTSPMVMHGLHQFRFLAV